MLRFFTSDLRRNIIKIVCLTLGLAIGFLLVAKIYFEETFDSFIPGCEDIYILTESFEINGEYREYYRIPGAIAPALERYSPLVESTTRSVNIIPNDTKVRTENGTILEVSGISMVDSCHFDVFPTTIIAGNPYETLAVKSNVMIPESLAAKMEGDPIGQELTLPEGNPDIRLIIGGIYKDYPLNSSLENAILLSLESIGLFTSFDGRENWMGNDYYTGYARLVEGTRAKELQPYVKQMLSDNIDSETLQMTNFNIGATPLIGHHLKGESRQTMIWIMSLLAIVILMCAGLNYLLVTIGQIGKRSKEMAIRKCYGTTDAKIFGRVIGESLFFLVVCIGLAILLVFCLSDVCHQLLGFTPRQLLTTSNVWIVEGSVCLLLLTVTGAIPAWVYCKTPVAHSFSSSVKNRKIWKLALLSVQFFASSLLLCMLVVIVRQYRHITTADIGIRYENIGVLELGYIPQSERSAIVSGLKALGVVEGVSSADDDFLSWGAGNNVWIGDDIEKEVNIADLYYANSDIVDVLGMKLLEGTTFDETTDSMTHQVLVEERFYDVMRKAGAEVEKGNLVGRSFNISEHVYEQAGITGHEYTVCGVIGNMKRGGFETENDDPRAAVIFPSQNIRGNVFIKFHHLDAESMGAAQQAVDKILNGKERYITPYKHWVMFRTESVKNFGLAVMLISISILLISLIGLAGYTSDEIQYRSKEIAIRKVSGYTAGQILQLFIKDIMKIALPATVLGGLVAIPIANRWISQFSQQAPLMPALNILCVSLLLITILCVVAANTLSIAKDNPVKHLYQE